MGDYGPFLLAVGGLLGVGGWVVDRRRRAYADLATTPAAAVFAGRNEVKGRAWAAEPLASHRTQTPSVWWRYVLEEERSHTRTVTSTDSNGNTHSRIEHYNAWHKIDERAEALPRFEMVDDSGSVPVVLSGARVVSRQVFHDVFRDDDNSRGFLEKLFDNRTGRYQEAEDAIAVGDTLFVCGEAELDDATGVPFLGREVLVTTRSEESTTASLTAVVFILVFFAIAAVTVGSGMLLGGEEPDRPQAWAPGLGAALLALAVAQAIVVYNRLRLLAQGVDRARSLVDVQLERRHDLVPQLADCVAAHAEHERTLLEIVASARAAAPTDAAQQTEQLRTVLARAEDLPDLNADESYQRLMDALADTENRIAGSRGFYNESLTLLRDRSQAFPGVLVARFVRPTHHDVAAAEGFERTVPALERSFSA